MAGDFLDNLFDSVDIIVQSKLNNLGFDKTEQCTIEKVKGNNVYYVSNGKTKFDAFAQNDATYKEKDVVYVTIPQGDYNNQKIIIGKYAANTKEKSEWASPMENFINITGNLIDEQTSKINHSLIINNLNENYKEIWSDSNVNDYSGYDRVCISADFTADLLDKNVIDGSYGLILVGDYRKEFSEEMQSEADNTIEEFKEDLQDKIDRLEENSYKNDYKDIYEKYKNDADSLKNKTSGNEKLSSLEELELNLELEIILLEEKIEIEQLDINNNFYNELKVEIEKEYISQIKEIQAKIEGLRSLLCIFDVKDMTGNPYNYSIPFNQQKLFKNDINNKISGLKLYFYKDLDWESQQFKKTFKDIDEEIVNNDDEDKKIYVKNINVSLGYSLETYSDETAVLYTLQPENFSQNEVTATESVKRTMKLRWVHHKDDNSYSITNLNHASLKGEYVKIHWYRYILPKSDTVINDPLAGYFWEEITGARDKFEYTATLHKSWKEENFKVIIEYNNTVIKSEVLEFKNPNGTVRDGNSLVGLKITYPTGDRYKGNFFHYSELSGECSLTGELRTLIAKYDQVESITGGNWETDDIICWKFPKDNTMIKTPQKGKEYNTTNGDIFIEAGSSAGATVGGIPFDPEEDYHLIIRKIIVKEEDDEDYDESLKTREQFYRIETNYNPLSKNNTIQCLVTRADVDLESNAEITFSFGYAKTNGTKYTLGVEWEETTMGEKKYLNENVITWIAGSSKEHNDNTKQVKFKVKIIDENDQEVRAPEGGWKVNLSWYCDEIHIPTGETMGQGIKDCFDFKNNNKEEPILEITFDPSKRVTYKNLYNYAKYQILKLTVTNFEYQLTKYIQIPIRSDRKVLGIEGAQSIIYDANGYNPRLINQKYLLKYNEILVKNPNTFDDCWRIRYSNSDEKIINDFREWKLDENGKKVEIDTKKVQNQTVAINGNMGNSQMPQLEKKISLNDDDTVKERGYYLVAPNMYLLRSNSSSIDGVCVEGRANKEKNAVTKWVQPILVMCDPYGSQFLNDWDGSMVIDEENNYIMTSMIGAGTKSTVEKNGQRVNTFTGVIMGDLNKIEDDGKDTFIDSGILGFQNSTVGFSLSTTGVATFGQPSTGQITLNGKNGYIISGGFNGFGGKTLTELNLESPPDENFSFGDLKLSERKGIYLGMKTGNACFAGTLHSSNGIIGGWKLDENKIYKEYQFKTTDENGKEITKTGRTIIQNPDVQDSSVKNTVFAVGEYITADEDPNEKLRYKNAAFSVTEDGILKANGAHISGEVIITSGGINNGNIGDWTVDANGLNNGTTKSILLSAGGIGKSNLKVNNNAPTNDSNGWTIYANGNFGVDTKGNLFANNATIEGTIKATSGEIGGCKITKEGNLEVPAANITGTLSADRIDADNLTVKAANITGTLSGNKISASSYVTCQGLKVGEKKYSFKEKTFFIPGGLSEMKVVKDVIYNNLGMVTKVEYDYVAYYDTIKSIHLRFLGEDLGD